MKTKDEKAKSLEKNFLFYVEKFPPEIYGEDYWWDMHTEDSGLDVTLKQYDEKQYLALIKKIDPENFNKNKQRINEGKVRLKEYRLKNKEKKAEYYREYYIEKKAEYYREYNLRNK